MTPLGEFGLNAMSSNSKKEELRMKKFPFD